MRRLLLVLAGLLVLVGLPAAPAHAHATLLSSTPADGVVLERAPDVVLLRFSEPVGTELASVRVTAPDGSRVDDGVLGLSPDGTVLRTGVRTGAAATGPGTYVLSWRVVSQDAHPISGTSTFSVERASAPAAVAEPDEAGGAAAALLPGARLAGFAGLLLLVGGVVHVLLVRPSARTTGSLRWVLGTGVVLVAAGGLAGLLLQGPAAAGLPLSRATDPALVRQVLATDYGLAHVVRLALLLPVAAELLLLVRRGPRRSSAVMAGLLGVPLLLTWPWSGHAAAGELAVLAVPLDALHLLAVGAWTGGLVVLAVGLRRTPADELAVALPRWSRLATGAVLVMVGTGLFASWREVRVPAALWSTDYGRLLLLKTALVLLMLALAAAGRAWVRRHLTLPVVHAAVTLDPPTARPAPPVAVLRRTVLAEAVLAAVVVAVTAGLVGTPPARSAYAAPASVEAALGGAGRVRVDLPAAVVGLASLEVRLTGPDGAPLEVPEVSARASRDGGDVVYVPLQERGPGRWGTDALAVPAPGTWRIDVSVRTTDVDVENASLTADFRER